MPDDPARKNDFDAFLVEALKAGIPALAFWEMTPFEVYAAIDAAVFREKQEQRGRAWIAWHTAALMRQKTLPRFEALVNPPRTKVLSKEEAKKHREEFEQIKKKLPMKLKGES